MVDNNLLEERAEFSQSGCALLGCQKISFVFKCGSGLGITFKGCACFLVLYPLVAYKLKAVCAFIIGQICIGSLNETVGKLVLLLHGGVSQSCICGTLGEVLGFFAAQCCVQVISCGIQGIANVFCHLLCLAHVLEHIFELGDVSGNFFRCIYKGAELIGAGAHDNIAYYYAVLETFVAEEQLLHVADTSFSGFTGKLGGFADVAAGTAIVDRPVNNTGNHVTNNANSHYRNDNVECFFVLHKAL